MKEQDIAVFKTFAFIPGQKLTIEDGPRRGDWEVVRVGRRKVTLRCPVSLREFEWDRFCYWVENRSMVWPQED